MSEQPTPPGKKPSQQVPDAQASYIEGAKQAADLENLARSLAQKTGEPAWQNAAASAKGTKETHIKAARGDINAQAELAAQEADAILQEAFVDLATSVSPESSNAQLERAFRNRVGRNPSASEISHLRKLLED